MLITLVRHGRTTANASGLMQGHLDNPLDATGREQALAARAMVGSADLVVSSPLQRARETAELLAESTPVHIDDRWIELDYGDWDGRPMAEVDDQTWQRWRADVDFAPPGGESLRRLGERVREALAQLAAGNHEHIVVVTHVSPIKAAVTWALGVGDEVGWRTFLATGSVTRMRVETGRPTLLSFNEVPGGR